MAQIAVSDDGKKDGPFNHKNKNSSSPTPKVVNSKLVLQPISKATCQEHYEQAMEELHATIHKLQDEKKKSGKKLVLQPVDRDGKPITKSSASSSSSKSLFDDVHDIEYMHWNQMLKDDGVTNLTKWVEPMVLWMPGSVGGDYELQNLATTWLQEEDAVTVEKVLFDIIGCIAKSIVNKIGQTIEHDLSKYTTVHTLKQNLTFYNEEEEKAGTANNNKSQVRQVKYPMYRVTRYVQYESEDGDDHHDQKFYLGTDLLLEMKIVNNEVLKVRPLRLFWNDVTCETTMKNPTTKCGRGRCGGAIPVATSLGKVGLSCSIQADGVYRDGSVGKTQSNVLQVPSLFACSVDVDPDDDDLMEDMGDMSATERTTVVAEKIDERIIEVEREGGNARRRLPDVLEPGQEPGIVFLGVVERRLTPEPLVGRPRIPHDLVGVGIVFEHAP